MYNQRILFMSTDYQDNDFEDDYEDEFEELDD